MGPQRTGRRRTPLHAAVAITATLMLAMVLAVVLVVLPVVIAAPQGVRESPEDSAAGAGEPVPFQQPPALDPVPAAPSPTGSSAPAPAGPPNIVLVVMDDFSVELLRTMPNLVALQQDAATYDNAFVVDSLCCPSRAATFTGLPPHLNGVFSNTSGGPLGALGGYQAFAANDDAERSYNVSLDEAGYRTGFVGRYLNEYEPGRTSAGYRIAPPLIEGWDDFEAVSGGAYQGWGFFVTHRDDDALELREYPRPDRADPARLVDQSYAGTVIADEALSLLRRYQRRDQEGDKPWLLHVAPYGTHARTQPSYPGEPLFPPALRDRPRERRPDGNCGLVACADLSVTDLPGYADPGEDNAPFRIDADGVVTPAATWRTDPLRLTEARGSTWYRQRAQMAQSIDRMLGRMIKRLGTALDEDTYLVVTSDNGLHLGQYSLNAGKGLPYDSDSRVPLVVAGPGVVPGERDQIVSNVDLAPTIEALAGAAPSGERAGASFADSLGTPATAGGRYVFMEHTYGPALPGEPDADLGSGGRLDIIPSYVAVRGESGLLVRVDLDRDFYGEDFAWELYRYDRPWEDVNVFDTDHNLPYARDLRRRLEKWVDCEPRKCRRLTR
ncbi:sulfatase [soil metagenome]